MKPGLLHISVIVPCFNDELLIGKCLKSLLAQTRDVLEIIVVDDQSTDGSAQEIQKYPVKYIRSSRRAGAGGARAAGADAASGDILAFVDSDCIAPADWVEKVHRTFTDNPNLGGVGGRYTHPPMKTLSGQLAALEEAYLFSIYANEPKSASPCGGVCAFRKEAWFQCRSGKDRRYFQGMGSGEDSVIGAEIKRRYEVKYLHDWTVSHRPKDQGGYFRRHLNRGFSRCLILAFGLTNSAESQVVFRGYGGWPLALSTCLLPLSLAGFWGFPETKWILFSAMAVALHFVLSQSFFSFVRAYPFEGSESGQRSAFYLHAGFRFLLAIRTLLWGAGVLKGAVYFCQRRIERFWNVSISILHFWWPGKISKMFFFVTSRCNARCGFCFNLKNVNNWKQRKPSELRLDEIRQIATRLGRLPYLTLSGGEPFLRDDLPEIIESFYRNAKTQWVTIPTNAALTSRVVDGVRTILQQCPDLYLTVQVSLDGLSEAHNQSRKIPDGFEKMAVTLKELALLQKLFSNLRIQIATLYDSANLAQIREIVAYCRANFQYDQQIFYLVRQPNELVNSQNASLVDGYLEFLKESEAWEFENRPRHLWSRAVRVLQRLAYRDLRQIKVENTYRRPCFATQKFVTLWDDGKISPCEVLENRPLGNIRNFSYDFYRLKKGQGVDRFYRQEIVQKKCSCDWICAPPINRLYDFRTIPAVISGFLFPRKFDEN
jgi:glycosyltransferase involved in cell wall biosynthesis/MoaA/NifB/PqqE/SkfB family radical SAM enzyme